MSEFIRFLFGEGPECGVRHPERDRLRCHSAPHPAGVVHLGVARNGRGHAWDTDGDVDMCGPDGRRATPAEREHWEYLRAAAGRV